MRIKEIKDEFNLKKFYQIGDLAYKDNVNQRKTELSLVKNVG